MKILLNPHIQKTSLSFKQLPGEYYNSASGKEVVNSYRNELDNLHKEEAREYKNVQNAIYNSLEQLANYGKYDTAKVLFKEIENEREIKQDYNLYNAMGDVYKKQNDIAKAGEFYETALKNADPNDGENYLKIEKNYLESLISQNGEADLNLQFLKDRKIPLSTVNYLELKSIIDMKAGNKSEAVNEIMGAYFIAKNNNAVSDELAYKAAIAMDYTGRYQDCIELCKKNLDKLDKENKIYTHEFLNFLTILGISTFKSSDEKENLIKAKNTLLNAREIEKIIPNKVLKETIEYNLLKINAKTGKINLSEAKDFIKECKNLDYKKDLCYDLAKENYDDDKDFALNFFNEVEDILLLDKDNNEKELLDLYTELSDLYPENSDEYSKKLNELKINDGLSLKQIISKLNKNTAEQNYDNVISIANEIIHSSSSGLTKTEVARTYKLFANIHKNQDFRKNTEDLEKNLELLERYKKDDSKNKELKEHLLESYKKLAMIYFEVPNYAKAAFTFQNADKAAEELELDEKQRAKLKVYQTLMFYKNKSYYSAEDSCLEFLKLISGNSVENIKSKDPMSFVKGNSDEECRKIASTFETLGLLNMKRKNFADAENYFQKAVKIREKLKSKDIFLANDYSALARLKIIGYWSLNHDEDSSELHQKCLDILKSKYPQEQFTQNEEEFHKKYYGKSVTSFCKYLPWRGNEHIIEKFKCYNKELNICE